MNQESLVADLRAEIASGSIVVVAGTGVSIMASNDQQVDGYSVARWDSLLNHGVDCCFNQDLITASLASLLKQQIASGEIDVLISAAEIIVGRLRGKAPGIYRGWLKDTVGQLEPTQPEILQALAALGGLLATLNYDPLLEKHFDLDAVTWKQADKVQHALRNRVTDSILHLHGYFDEPDSVVLGLKSYQDVVKDPHTQAVLQLFLLGRTLLFVGCGGTFQDPNFLRLIQWAGTALEDTTHRHFRLCSKDELAKVRAESPAVPWLYPVVYGARHEDLVDFLKSLVPAGGAARMPKPALRPRLPDLDLAGYRDVMRRKYSRLKLEELDPTTHDVRLTLMGMFIPQTARECTEFLPRVYELPKEILERLRLTDEIDAPELDAETLGRYRQSYYGQSPLLILEILADPDLDRLVVLGDPGSGKSSLLQYLLLEWADGPTADLAALPLFLELRQYARLRSEGQIRDFLDFFAQGSTAPWHFDRGLLEAWLQQRPSILLVDGLDEVFDPAQRDEIATAVQRFADTYGPARVIVTSRHLGYKHQPWRDADFRHFMLQELDPLQIDEFLARWHREAYADRGHGEQKRQGLARAIADSRAIRELAGNPLLLTMMAILNRTQDLPRDRAELYEQSARLLLHQWKVEQALAHDVELAKASLDYKDKRNMLMQVARAMQSSPGGLEGNLIDEQVLEQTLATALGSVPNLRPDWAARALIEQLRGRNFMLCSLGGRSYAFVHRTFLEYFCAADLKEQFESKREISPEQLKEDVYGLHWDDKSWHEVLSLLAGMIAPRFLREVLEFLLEKSDPERTSQQIFLAARCIGEVRNRAELWPVTNRVRQQLQSVAGVDESWDREEIKKVSAVRTSAVKLIATVWHDSAETLVWLKDRAQSDKDNYVRQVAVQELARSQKDDPETLSWLKARAQSDKGYHVRQAAVQELARGWKDDPETLSWLKARANGDDNNWEVRQAAVQELARGWRDDPETVSILKARAQSDEDWHVRQAAVRELARGWRDDPETLSILKARAHSDKDSNVRQTAMRELARGWRDDAETVSWLKARAQSDKHWDMRQTAVQELVRGWKDDPETLSILVARAQSDSHWNVRGAAMQELARGWKDDPDALLIILKARAHGEKDNEVRRAALHELARGWKDDPETLPILKACARCDDHWDVRQAAVQEVAYGWKDDPETVSWLKARAQSDKHWDVRQTAVQELVRGWKADPETLSILVARAQSDSNWNVRGAAVQELARGWKDDPDALLIILMARAHGEKDNEVRRAALQELARGWKDDPETLPILKARAHADEHWDVRQAAVQEVAYGWKDDPETVCWLKAHAQSDKHWDVRRAAMQELARGWKNDPETLSIVKARAHDDKDNDVRQTAVRELARGWRYDPETLSILKARGQSDKHWDVRRAAVQELANGWHDDPKTVSWLKARAQSDANPAVRQAALQELARGRKDDPEVSALLSEHGQR